MKNDREEQIKLHHEKWKRWKEQMKNQGNKPQKKIEKPVQSTQKFAAKIIGKLQQDTTQKNKVASENFKKQFENNSCSNCFELMIPPRNPMSIYPCGHHMCKICLLGNNPKNTSIKIKKCSQCLNPIENYTVNISLMNLICSFTNNTHLIQREKQIVQQQGESIEDPSLEETINRLKLRCDILQKQRKAINGTLAKKMKEKQILSEVMSNLKDQKKKNNEELEAAKKEAKLIDDFLNQKKEQLQKIKSKITNAEQKKRVVDKALEPLRMQKQKMQILQVAKMVNKQSNK